MYIVPIAWMFVVLLMTAAEATSTQGTLLGAFFTFLLYGVIPLAIILYLMGTPSRWRARRAADAAELAEAPPADARPTDTPPTPSARDDADGSGHAAGAGRAPEGKEP